MTSIEYACERRGIQDARASSSVRTRAHRDRRCESEAHRAVSCPGLVPVVVEGEARQTALVIRQAQVARQLWSRLEPIHGVTYFSPEARTALSGAGYKGFWMGYFAGRAAAMGPVGAEVVLATFYNFSIAHVSRAIPDAWTFAPPSAALEARQRGAAAALQRAFGGNDFAEAVETAAVLARAAAGSAPMEGRALFAA